jgi:hypothetical protein
MLMIVWVTVSAVEITWAFAWKVALRRDQAHQLLRDVHVRCLEPARLDQAEIAGIRLPQNHVTGAEGLTPCVVAQLLQALGVGKVRQRHLAQRQGLPVGEPCEHHAGRVDVDAVQPAGGEAVLAQAGDVEASAVLRRAAQIELYVQVLGTVRRAEGSAEVDRRGWALQRTAVVEGQRLNPTHLLSVDCEVGIPLQRSAVREIQRRGMGLTQGVVHRHRGGVVEGTGIILVERCGHRIDRFDVSAQVELSIHLRRGLGWSLGCRQLEIGDQTGVELRPGGVLRRVDLQALILGVDDVAVAVHLKAAGATVDLRASFVQDEEALPVQRKVEIVAREVDVALPELLGDRGKTHAGPDRGLADTPVGECKDVCELGPGFLEAHRTRVRDVVAGDPEIRGSRVQTAQCCAKWHVLSPVECAMARRSHRPLQPIRRTLEKSISPNPST